MKIKSIKPAGIEPVYNMTVDKHHNYLIAGGLILKNCDALRYFCQLRTLKPEQATDEEEYDEYDGMEDYEDYMTGGSLDVSYLSYGR